MHKCIKEHKTADQRTFKARPECLSVSVSLQPRVVFSVLLSSIAWLICREGKQLFEAVMENLARLNVLCILPVLAKKDIVGS